MADDFDPAKVAWVFDPLGVERLCAALEGATEIAFDLETTGLDEWHPKAKIVLASFTLDNYDTWLLPLYHPESPFLGSWRFVFRRAVLLLVGKFLEMHNGKFDCRWAERHVGVDLSGSLMWDSRISSHLLDENRSTKLKIRVQETFDVERWDDFDLSHSEAALSVPLIDLGLYAARDTYWTKRLSENHRIRMYVHDESPYPPLDSEEIEEARLGRLSHWVGQPTVRTMTAVEQRGIALDMEWVQAKIDEDTVTRNETRQFLATRYGRDPANASFAPTSHWFRDWCADAVEAGDLRVQAMTKGGKPQWSKEVLVRQRRAGSEVASQLLDHRQAVKRLEYLYSWKGFCKEDGAIHASYNVGALITGRLSSSGPNMQQITKALRPAYVPRKGYVIADFDYSQIELRTGAFFFKCQPMIEALQRGDDLHRILAARITRKDMNLITPEERQGAKAGNFGFLFGQTAYGFKFYAENTYGISFTEEECTRIYDAFFNEWDGMSQAHAKVISRAHATGQVVSPLGRVRRLPGLYSANPGAVKHAENAALNAPVQGFASDLMQTAAASIEGTLPGSIPVEGARLVGTVHDSIVAELREDDWKEIALACIERMTQHVQPVMKRLDCDFNVPLVAEATIGTRWGLKDVGELSA